MHSAKNLTPVITLKNLLPPGRGPMPRDGPALAIPDRDGETSLATRLWRKIGEQHRQLLRLATLIMCLLIVNTPKDVTLDPIFWYLINSTRRRTKAREARSMVLLLLHPMVRRCSGLSVPCSRDCIPSPRFTSPTLPAMRRLVGSHRYTWYVSVEHRSAQQDVLEIINGFSARLYRAGSEKKRELYIGLTQLS